MIKYKLKCVALFSLLAAGVLGCEMEQEIDLPEHEPKLTLRLALFNVDSLQDYNIQYRYSQLFIGRSQSVLYPDENLAGTDNATVRLYDENGAVVEEYTHFGEFRSEYGYSSEVPGYYAPTKNFAPEPGKTYTIRASAYGFQEITATTTMPERPTVADLSFKGDPQTSQGELTLTINDEISRKHYYRVVVLPLDSAYNRIAYPANTIDGDNGTDLGNNEKPQLGRVFSDELYTSGKLSFSSRIGFAPMNYSDNQTDKKVYTRYLEVQVQQLSEEEYLFLKTLEAQWQSEDNPFAESQNIYSNVRNGYGVLGGISVSSFYVAAD